MTTSPPHTPLARPAGPRLADLTDDLLWPRLLASAGLALRPGRIGICFFALVIVGLLGMIPLLWRDGPNAVLAALDAIADLFGALLAGLLGLDAATLGEAGGAFIARPRALLARGTILETLVVGLPALAVFAIAGGAVCRAVALDFTQNVGISWPRALGFALGRWASLLGAVLAPLLLVAAIMLGLAVGGWLLLNWPVIDLLGALLYGLFLLAALAAVVTILAYAVGSPMLVPAVACEGTDAIDAIQRSYAYVLGRPLRLVVYGLLLILLGLVATGLAYFIARSTVAFAAHSVTWFTEDARAASIVAADPALEGTAAAAARIVAFWTSVALLLAGAYTLSYFYTASTLLYLAMRRVCDGQDMDELWMPGMIEGAMARAMAGRAQAAAAAGKLPAEVRPLAEGASDL